MGKPVKAIQAIYKDGFFRPLEQVHLTEPHKVWLIYFPTDDETLYPLPDDLPAHALAKLAESGGSFDFLADPAKDVYTLDDGEEV